MMYYTVIRMKRKKEQYDYDDNQGKSGWNAGSHGMQLKSNALHHPLLPLTVLMFMFMLICIEPQQ